jgi:hypothetical protein
MVCPPLLGFCPLVDFFIVVFSTYCTKYVCIIAKSTRTYSTVYAYAQLQLCPSWPYIESHQKVI